MTKAIIYKLLEELPEFYNKDNNTTTYQFLYSLAQEFETTENNITELHNNVFVDTSTGIYLNDLAKLFRIRRDGGETDDSLRARIKAHWAGVGGGGTLASIKSALSNAFSVPQEFITINESEFMKLGIIISTNEEVPDNVIDAMNEMLKKSVAAGIWVEASYSLANALEDALEISELVETFEGTTGIFTAGVSLAGGADTA
jgi:hypothetical protein